MDKVQTSVILRVVHHRQNPIDPLLRVVFPSYLHHKASAVAAPTLNDGSGNKCCGLLTTFSIAPCTALVCIAMVLFALLKTLHAAAHYLPKFHVNLCRYERLGRL
jgi:hypothetical protein